MPNQNPSLVVAFDTSSDMAGVAIFEGDALVEETTWNAHMSHSRDLLPAMDALLARRGRRKDEVSGICICLGPGSYAGLRVGLTTAKTLAFALEAQLVGIGRLAADASALAAAVSPRRVVALHAAGRAELAWATYVWSNGGLSELSEPSLAPAASLIELLSAEDVVCIEAGTLPPAFEAALLEKGILPVDCPATRVVAIGLLGLQRLAAGAVDNPDTLVPLYLRAPAIGPQTPL